jgi:hypothetical protein
MMHFEGNKSHQGLKERDSLVVRKGHLTVHSINISERITIEKGLLKIKTQISMILAWEREPILQSRLTVPLIRIDDT